MLAPLIFGMLSLLSRCSGAVDFDTSTAAPTTFAATTAAPSTAGPTTAPPTTTAAATLAASTIVDFDRTTVAPTTNAQTTAAFPTTAAPTTVGVRTPATTTVGPTTEPQTTLAMTTGKLTTTAITVTTASPCKIGDKCLKCICQVEGCKRLIGKCRKDKGSLSCGPYQIKKPYWIDCGRPGGGWKMCTKQMKCSEKCVRAYMNRYACKRTGNRRPTCQDYARIHNGGPNGCQNPATLGYWQKVSGCCGGPNGCD